MLPYYQGGYLSNENQQSSQQEQEESFDTYGQRHHHQQQQQQQQSPEEESKNHHQHHSDPINQTNFSTLPVTTQETMQQQQQQQQQTSYPPFVLMHDQTYPEFTYDNSMLNDPAITPLPAPSDYARQQEDVFRELITLASHRQQQQQRHQPLPLHQQQHNHHHHHHHHHHASDPFPYATNLPSTSSTTNTTSGPLPLHTAASSLSSSSSSSLAPIAWDHLSQERIYELIVVQQPYRARMCGFGDKDRRPISPPPILQLVTRTKDGQIVKPETIDVSFFIVLCDSWHEDGTTEANLVYHSFSSPQQQQQQLLLPSSSSTTSASSSLSPSTIPLSSSNEEITKTLQMRNLVGSSVASAAKLYDLDGNLGIFFVFQDISFRTEGKFKLAFSLINVGSPCGTTVNTSTSTHVLTRVFTDLFTVYTAKKFPGVVKSTPLSQCFAKQGIKIPIRKDTQAKRKKSTKQSTIGTSHLDEEEEEDDGDE